MTTLITLISIVLVVIGFRTIKATPTFIMSVLLLVATLTIGITHAHANDHVLGTKKEFVQVQKQVQKGIYVNEVGTVVSKPTFDICNMYRNTYTQYQKKYGTNKGARVWLVIITRRGC